MEIEVGNPVNVFPSSTISDKTPVVSFEESHENLAYHAYQNKSVILFLRLMGVVWILNEGSATDKAIQFVWGSLIRVGLLGFTGFGVAFSFGLAGSHRALAATVGLAILFGATMLLQGITMGFALWDMNRRLNSKVPSHYCSQLTAGLRSSYLVLLISFVLGILPMVSTGDYVLMVAEIVLSCVLTATMYFISTDCSVALYLLDYLLAQTRKECLTFEQYSIVRNEIHDRLNFSSWINNSIIIVALLDVAAVLIFVLTISLNLNAVAQCIIIAGLFLKEIPFLMVVYWQVAQVNEKSSLLLKELGTTRWLKHPQGDNERFGVYINAQSKPIVMQLAGMKLKRKDLAWQFALWLFAFVVSIFKAALEKRL